MSEMIWDKNKVHSAAEAQKVFFASGKIESYYRPKIIGPLLDVYRYECVACQSNKQT